MRVFSAVSVLASGVSASNFLRQTRLSVERQEPGSWVSTCTSKGGLVTPYYAPTDPGASVPVFCVTATVCKGHLGRKESESALPITIFDRETKLRVEQKACTEKGETACCTDVLAEGNLASCDGTGTNAPCKLGDAASFKDYASLTQEFEPNADAFKDDCTNKTPTTDSKTTIESNKLAPPK